MALVLIALAGGLLFAALLSARDFDPVAFLLLALVGAFVIGTVGALVMGAI